MTFKLDSSGLVHILRADVTCEKELENATVSENATESNSTNTTNASSSSKKADKKKTPVIKSELSVQLDYTADELKAWSPEELAHSKAKLAHLQRLDELRLEKEEAKNGLESFVYSVRAVFKFSSSLSVV